MKTAFLNLILILSSFSVFGQGGFSPIYSIINASSGGGISSVNTDAPVVGDGVAMPISVNYGNGLKAINDSLFIGGELTELETNIGVGSNSVSFKDSENGTVDYLKIENQGLTAERYLSVNNYNVPLLLGGVQGVDIDNQIASNFDPLTGNYAVNGSAARVQFQPLRIKFQVAETGVGGNPIIWQTPFQTDYDPVSTIGRAAFNDVLTINGRFWNELDALSNTNGDIYHVSIGNLGSTKGFTQRGLYAYENNQVTKIITAQSDLRFDIPNVTAADAATANSSASVSVGRLFIWDDGSAKHVMVKK